MGESGFEPWSQRQIHLPSLLPVSDGGCSDEFWWTWALATALAVTVKAVWGTSLGIRGTSLLPSIDHSEELFGPDMLMKTRIIKQIKTSRDKQLLWDEWSTQVLLVRNSCETFIVHCTPHFCTVTLGWDAEESLLKRIFKSIFKQLIIASFSCLNEIKKQQLKRGEKVTQDRQFTLRLWWALRADLSCPCWDLPAPGARWSRRRTLPILRYKRKQHVRPIACHKQTTNECRRTKVKSIASSPSLRRIRLQSSLLRSRSVGHTTGMVAASWGFSCWIIHFSLATDDQMQIFLLETERAKCTKTILILNVSGAQTWLKSSILNR